MKLTPPDIQKYLELLTDTPRRFAAATEGMDDSRLGCKPDPGTWSALKILAHLQACADVWGASIESMLAGQEPVLPDIHPREWIKRTDYLTLQYSELLQAFTCQRWRFLEILNRWNSRTGHAARRLVITGIPFSPRHGEWQNMKRNIACRWRKRWTG